MSSFLPTDKFRKTVVIPVSIKNGKIENLPEMRDTTVAYLVVPEYVVQDKNKLKKFSEEYKVPFLKQGTLLLAQIKVDDRDSLTKELWKYLHDIHEKYQPSKSIHGLTNAYFVEVILKQDLTITLRGTKKAKLNQCKCDIEILQKEANSLNHAYTLISQEFEKSRISHGGNVFQNMYFLDESKKWNEIDKLRGHLESTQKSENSIF